MKDKAKAEEILTKLFGSTSRARILILLLENIGRSFYQREIVYETSLSLQAIHGYCSSFLLERSIDQGIFSGHIGIRIHYLNNLQVNGKNGIRGRRVDF